MHEQFDSPIAWLIGFLNLNFDGGKADKKRIERFFERVMHSAAASAAPVQARWRRRLTWLAENATLTESLGAGVETLAGLIAGQRQTIRDVAEGRLSKEELDQDEKSFHERLEAWIASCQEMKRLAWLSERELQSRKKEVLEALSGAKFVTREQALNDLLNTLNDYNGRIKYSWQLHRATKRRLAPGQCVLNVNGKKFTVDRFPVGEDFDTYVALVVSKCLENGSLDRLKRCRECRTFFYASHLAKNYCKPEHQREHDKREAPARAKQWRTDHPPDD